MDDKSPQLKVVSPQLIIKGAVTARLYKKEQAIKLSYSFGSQWDLESQPAQQFIHQIEAKFRRKSKFHSYLLNDKSRNSVPVLLSDYISHTETKVAFESLCEGLVNKITSETMNKLGSVVSDSNLVFVHYVRSSDPEAEEEKGRLLVVMVDKKGVFDFDDELTPRKFESIDTEALRQAAAYDLTLFDEVYPENDGEPYLHFIDGRSKSDFFKDALGCEKEIDNKKSASETLRALKDFYLDHDYEPDVCEKLEEKIEELFKKKRKLNQPVSLNDVQATIDLVVTAEMGGKGEFTDFVNDNEYKVNAYFDTTHHDEKKIGLLFLEDTTQNFKVEVNRFSIGSEGSGKTVIIEEDGSYLKFPILDSNLRAEILKLANGE